MGYSYHGNTDDVINGLEGNFNNPVISLSAICVSDLNHKVLMFNCSEIYISCKKPFRASLMVLFKTIFRHNF